MYFRSIENVISNLKELLQFFKGDHSISIRRLIKCEPFEFRGTHGIEIRNWKIANDKSLEFTITNPKPAKLIAVQGNSFGESGWGLKAVFDIADIKDFNFGIICSSYKTAKEYWDHTQQHNEEIKHWQFQETRKSRKVRCNGCNKQLINLTAQQCSECGKYYCDECMTESTCLDCGMKDD